MSAYCDSYFILWRFDVKDEYVELMHMRNEMADKERLEEKLKKLRTTKVILEARLREQKEVFDKEYGDVEKINKKNINYFAYKLFGKYDEKMSKEKEELFEAGRIYNETKNELYAVDEKYNAVLNEIEWITHEETKYRTRLEKIKEMIMNIDIEGKEYVLQIDKELKWHYGLDKELNEAVLAGKRAVNMGDKFYGISLRTGGVNMITSALSAAKTDYEKDYEFVKVNEVLSEFQLKYSIFQRELNDVHDYLGRDDDIVKYMMFSEAEYRNAVHSGLDATIKIGGSERLKNFLREISEILKKLEDKKFQNDSRIKELNDAMEKILIRLQKNINGVDTMEEIAENDF